MQIWQLWWLVAFRSHFRYMLDEMTNSKLLISSKQNACAQSFNEVHLVRNRNCFTISNHVTIMHKDNGTNVRSGKWKILLKTTNFPGKCCKYGPKRFNDLALPPLLLMTIRFSSTFFFSRFPFSPDAKVYLFDHVILIRLSLKS